MLNISERGDVQLIELDHGKVNVLDLELVRALVGAFGTPESDRPIVLTGAGRAFSAGVDLRRIVEGGPDYATEFLEALAACFLAVYDYPGPVVAAVNGAAIAGGCVIAAACDRRLISGGPIGLAELAVGVPFPTSAVEIMRSVLGPRTADLVHTARTVDAEEALAIGLVDRVVAEDELLAAAFDEAAGLGALPHGVFALTKRQLHAPARDLIRVREAEDDAVVRRLWASDEVRRAVREYMAEIATR